MFTVVTIPVQYSCFASNFLTAKGEIGAVRDKIVSGVHSIAVKIGALV